MNDEDLEEFLSSTQRESDIEKFQLEDRHGSGFKVLIRFRNQKDYEEFADLIEQPKLKVYSKLSLRTTSWPLKEPENSLFD